MKGALGAIVMLKDILAREVSSVEALEALRTAIAAIANEQELVLAVRAVRRLTKITAVANQTEDMLAAVKRLDGALRAAELRS